MSRASNAAIVGTGQTEFSKDSGRSELQLACECMKRYMAVVPVTRKRLQLVGIGALCLTCKHEEVMIPNMNDFIYICDNAYELDALLQIEVEILSALNMQLHVPTPHDQLLPLLRAIGEAPLNAYPEAIEFSRLRSWHRIPRYLPLRPCPLTRPPAEAGTATRSS